MVQVQHWMVVIAFKENADRLQLQNEIWQDMVILGEITIHFLIAIV